MSKAYGTLANVRNKEGMRKLAKLIEKDEFKGYICVSSSSNDMIFCSFIDCKMDDVIRAAILCIRDSIQFLSIEEDKHEDGHNRTV